MLHIYNYGEASNTQMATKNGLPCTYLTKTETTCTAGLLVKNLSSIPSDSLS